MQIGINQVEITRYQNEESYHLVDNVVVEEPLELRIKFLDNSVMATKLLGILMRTPGHDEYLILGYLFVEHIINSMSDVKRIHNLKRNIYEVELSEEVKISWENINRNVVSTSSCGICGRNTINDLNQKCNIISYPYDDLKLNVNTILSFTEKQNQQQSSFNYTGGIHACTQFSVDGQYDIQFEDIGRHNALDKLIGYNLLKNKIPCNQKVLFLSGRAGFEMIQKAVVAGYKIVISIGAPSSLAVELAEEWNMTLIGFLRGQKFNIYSGEQRIVI